MIHQIQQDLSVVRPAELSDGRAIVVVYGLTVLLTTHSPYFLQAIELYSRQYDKRDGAVGNLKVYRAKVFDSLGRVEFEDVSGNTSEMYRKFAATMRELDYLRSEVVEEE